MRSQRIAIECRSEDHPRAVAKVALLEQDSRGRWHATSAGDRRSQMNLDHLTSTLLIGDDPATDARPEDLGTRWAHDWRCKLCGRRAALRGEKVDPTLDRIADAGLNRVPLKHFL